MARNVSEFELYNLLEAWLRGRIESAWSCKSIFGKSTIPIEDLPRAMVRCFNPDGGGVTAAGTAHSETWTWSFEIVGRFPLTGIGGDVLPHQMTKLHQLISAITPYTINLVVPESEKPTPQTNVWWVNEFGPLDCDVSENWHEVFVSIRLETEVTV